MLLISPPFPLFTDKDGDPLEAGYIYIGVASKNPETNPISVYWDSVGTQPAAQPLRTVGGYPVCGGTPARLYVNASDFSITVRNKQGAMVYNLANCTGTVTSTAITASPIQYGAVGDGVADDSVAVAAAFATGLVVDGGGKSYKVVPNTIIDTYAGAGVGYGAAKSWFTVGPCQNITFVGDISFGSGGAYFLGKQQYLQTVTVTGDARFSAWYTTFRGVVVSGKTYMNGDFPPTTNWVGCYYNTFIGCDFNPVVVDQRYGPFNSNTFIECQFDTFLVTYTGNSGYNPANYPYRDFHMNTFIGCEWTSNTGLLAPDGYYYPMVIDNLANSGGLNKVICPYQEHGSRGFYGAFQVENLHLSGFNVINGGGEVGYNIPLSGEAGTSARCVPHLTPIGDVLVGGDWSVLNSFGYPYCLTQNGHTVTLGTDAQEPTGLSKYAQFATGASFSTVTINFGMADSNNRTLRSFAIVYKVTVGSVDWEVLDASGAILYGAVSQTRLSNGWVLAYGQCYGFARMTSASAYTVRISAISGGRGSGIVSPVTKQQGGKPMIDLSNGPSLLNDALVAAGAGSGFQATKSMQSSSGNVDWFRIDLSAFSGNSMNIRVNFSLTSVGGGSRQFYRESLIIEGGSGSLVESNLHAVSGANGSLSFVLSGATLTVRTTSSIVSAETARMAIQIMGYDMTASRITAL